MPKTRISWLSICVCVILVCLTGCNSPSSIQTSAVSGSLNLISEDNTLIGPGIDASIALYEEATIDERYLAFRSEYDFVGKELTQRDYFDHRNQAPIAVVETDEQGIYEFTNIPYGTYNLVVVKEGWDLKYIYGIDVNQNSISLAPIDIKECIIVNHDLEVFKTDRTYIVQQDVTITSTQVILEGGFRLYIEPGASFNISSICEFDYTPNKSTFITTLDGMYELGLPRTLGKYYQLYFSSLSDQQVINFDNLNVSHAAIGLRGHANCLNVANSSFVNNTKGIVISNNPELGWEFGSVISNNVFMDNDVGDGVICWGPSSGDIQNNIFFGLSSGAQVKDMYAGRVQNNIFCGNDVGLTTYHLTGQVNNNLFRDNSEFDVIYYLNQGESEISSQIYKNEFYSDNGIFFSVSNDYIWLNSIMRDNNFYNSTYFYKTKIIYYDWLDPYMEFSNIGNYYLGATTPEQIEFKVHHYMNEDYSSEMFSPISISTVPNLNCGPIQQYDIIENR